jgi:hypothetical protein
MGVSSAFVRIVAGAFSCESEHLPPAGGAQKGAWVCGLLAFLINHQPRGEPPWKLISTDGDNLLLHPYWFHLKPFYAGERSLRVHSEYDIILRDSSFMENSSFESDLITIRLEMEKIISPRSVHFVYRSLNTV